jgi:limonene-1,2-epoxide hydrolase
VASFFREDAAYHNGPMEPIKGREAIQATLASFMGMGGQVAVDIGHLVAEGAIVMTERVDHFTGTEGNISLPVMGIFEVHDGAITAWRDYFDSTPSRGTGTPGRVVRRWSALHKLEQARSSRAARGGQQPADACLQGRINARCCRSDGYVGCNRAVVGVTEAIHASLNLEVEHRAVRQSERRCGVGSTARRCTEALCPRPSSESESHPLSGTASERSSQHRHGWRGREVGHPDRRSRDGLGTLVESPLAVGT